MKILFTLILWFPIHTFAQQLDQNGLKSIMKSNVQEMGKAFLNEDYEKIVEFMYPNVIAISGGKEKLIEGMINGKSGMANKGIKLTDINFGDPIDIIEHKNTLQSIIPQTITLNIPNGKLRSTASLLAISENNGKSWFFTDVSQKSTEQILNYVPEFSTELKVPYWKEPIFTPN